MFIRFVNVMTFPLYTLQSLMQYKKEMAIMLEVAHSLVKPRVSVSEIENVKPRESVSEIENIISTTQSLYQHCNLSPPRRSNVRLCNTWRCNFLFNGILFYLISANLVFQSCSLQGKYQCKSFIVTGLATQLSSHFHFHVFL